MRIRLEEAKAAVLVLLGVRADGTKELIAMTDGYREWSEAWAGLLRVCAGFKAARGFGRPYPNAPHLVALVRAGARFHRAQLAERPEGLAA